MSPPPFDQRSSRARAFRTIRNTRLILSTLCLPASMLACAGNDTSQVQAVTDPSPVAEGSAAQLEGMVNTAFHIAMRDGVRIAVDLWLPSSAKGEAFPTILRATRYWRDQAVLDRESEPETDGEAMAKSFVGRGYAYMAIDARGTGASFGSSAQPWSPKEIADYGEIVDWVASQPWSNGRIGAFGISYDSNTAEMMGTFGNGAVQAVIPRFGYPDVYSDVMFPGGIFNQGFVRAWLDRGRLMDANDICHLAALSGPTCEAVVAAGAGIKRVDADADGSVLRAALSEHKQGPDEYASVELLECRDDLWDGVPFDSLSPGLRGANAESTQTAFMAWASWMDLGTAQGALNRWAATDVPMVVYIGPWNHDASSDANPYHPKEAPLDMSADEQRSLELAFFDQHLKPTSEPEPARKIVYFTLGEDAWKETPVWPPAGTALTSFYLRTEHALSASAPAAAEPADGYAVDFTATTGSENGWWTKFDAADVYRADRRTEDEKLLVYTSAPLALDTEITGHPQVTLYLSSTETDGAVFVYLEDVAPDGSVTYLTEGELRLSQRRLCDEPAAFNAYGPCHGYRYEDVLAMPPGELQEVTLGLHPTSVLLRAGHSIRVAIAGHDASSFARIPAEGLPRLSLAHDPEHASRLELPIAPPRVTP